MSTPDRLINMSDDELAKFQEGCQPDSYPYIIAEKEWQRRERIEQHKLDLDLINKQVKWMKFSAILGVVSVIIGAVVGAYLQKNWSQQPQPTIQQEISESTPAR